MKKSLEEHAARFDDVAGEYDDSQNDTEEYRACVSLVVEHADPDPGETVADLGTGTGAIALALADDAGGQPASSEPSFDDAHEDAGGQPASSEPSFDDTHEDAVEVVGRDISEGMMERAREKADSQGIDNVEFGEGRFREPNVDSADVVVSNFAMHHLGDAEKREAVEAVADLGPRKFVLGDVMFFGAPDPDEPFYSPEVDDPSTVGHLADALTDEGFALTAVERVHEQVGVLVAERAASSDE